MRYRKPKFQYGDGEAKTWCTVDEVEFDVLVTWESSPEEKDVNWPGSFEITGVYLEDQGCILDKLSNEELDDLTMRMQEIAFPDDDGEY